MLLHLWKAKFRLSKAS